MFELRGSQTWIVCLALGSAGCPAHAVSPEPEDPADSQDDGFEPPPPGSPTTGAAPTTEVGSSGAGSTGSTTGVTDETGGDAMTGSTGSTGTTGACGDGIVDAQAGEQCDLGYAENHDNDSPCTQTCQHARCGDGLLWTGHEQCDLGPDNNDSSYNGCREDCNLGARCGDMIKQAEEECDASAPVIEGEVQCVEGTCSFAARVAFVTAESFSGDVGGLAGADALCVAAATAAGLDNASQFLAYLGDGASAPASRFTDGLKAPGYPYTRRDGQKLADDLADIFATGLRVPLEVTEYGTTLPRSEFPEYAWTGVGIHGEPADKHCEGWNTASFLVTGQAGQIAPLSDSEADVFAWRIDAHWTKYTARPCKDKVHLYCFED